MTGIEGFEYDEPTVSRGNVYGVSGRERSYSLATWQEKTGLDPEPLLRPFASLEAHGLWLWSKQPGTGKTGLAIGYLIDASLAVASGPEKRNGRSSVIVRIPRLALMGFEGLERTLDMIADRWVSMILFDDLTRVPLDKAWHQTAFHEVIDAAYRRSLRPLVTAQVSASASFDAMPTSVHAALDRLFDGGLHVVELEGNSRR